MFKMELGDVCDGVCVRACVLGAYQPYHNIESFSFYSLFLIEFDAPLRCRG